MFTTEAEKYTFKLEELDISPDEVEKVANQGSDMPSYHDFLSTELEMLNDSALIRGGYIIKKSEISSDEIHIGDKVLKTGKTVSAFLRAASHSAVFVCTAGEETVKRSEILNHEGQILESYLLDVLGTIMVEKAMDRLHEKLKSSAESHGLKVTNRYSPGYCEWDIMEQRKLFSLLPERFCDIQLSEYSLMIPKKSVSGIIGIGKDVSYQKYVCKSCKNIHCLYRNTG